MSTMRTSNGLSPKEARRPSGLTCLGCGDRANGAGGASGRPVVASHQRVSWSTPVIRMRPSGENHTEPVTVCWPDLRSGPVLSDAPSDRGAPTCWPVRASRNWTSVLEEGMTSRWLSGLKVGGNPPYIADASWLSNGNADPTGLPVPGSHNWPWKVDAGGGEEPSRRRRLPSGLNRGGKVTYIPPGSRSDALAACPVVTSQSWA